MDEYIEYQNELTSSADEIPDALDYDKFTEALGKAKNQLSPRQREIFELNKEYGMSISDISCKISVSEQVVRNQLSAALKILRVELRQYYPLLLLFLA